MKFNECLLVSFKNVVMSYCCCVGPVDSYDLYEKSAVVCISKTVYENTRPLLFFDHMHRW